MVWSWGVGGGGAEFCTGIWAAAKPAYKETISKKAVVSENERMARSALVGRGVVAGLRVDRKGRKSFRSAQLDLNFAPTRIMGVIAWFVSQNILVAQLHADLGRNVRKIIKMLDGENAAARQFRNLRQERRTVELLWRAIAITKGVVNADGIELGIGFLNQPLDIAFVVPTMIIPSIGKNEQGTLGVMCTPHLAKAEVDGVQQGGAAFGGSKQHAALQVFHAVGEGTGEFGALIEADQKKLVLRISGFKELQSGFAGFVHFVGHAAVKIENHANGDGHIFRGEADDFLFQGVFKDAEIVLFEASDQAVVRIGYGDIDQGEIDVRTNDFSRSNFQARRIFADDIHSCRRRSWIGRWWGRILGVTKQGKEKHRTNEQVGPTKQRKYASLT